MFYKFVKNIVNIIFRIFYRIEIINPENIEKNKKLIICSNHRHNLDVVLISILFPNQIHWMGKKELFKFKPMGYILEKLGSFPVDRDNPGLSAIKNSMRILKNNNTLGIFPEGTRVKSFDIKNAKPGVALISISTKSPIKPVYIDTNYRIFSKVRIYIGQSFEFSEAYNERLSSQEYEAYGVEVLKKIYDLKED